MSWTTLSVSPTAAWAPMRSLLTTVDRGVDFRLEIRNTGYFRLSSDRPVILMDVQPEGSE